MLTNHHCSPPKLVKLNEDNLKCLAYRGNDISVPLRRWAFSPKFGEKHISSHWMRPTMPPMLPLELEQRKVWKSHQPQLGREVTHRKFLPVTHITCFIPEWLHQILLVVTGAHAGERSLSSAFRAEGMWMYTPWLTQKVLSQVPPRVCSKPCSRKDFPQN